MKKLNLSLMKQASFRVPMNTARTPESAKDLPPFPPPNHPTLISERLYSNYLSTFSPLTERAIPHNRTMMDLNLSSLTDSARSSDELSENGPNEKEIRALKIQQYKLEREIQDVSAQRNEYKRQTYQLKAENAYLKSYINNIYSYVENINYKQQLDNVLAENVRLLQQIDLLYEKAVSEPHAQYPDYKPVSQQPTQRVTIYIEANKSESNQLEAESLRYLLKNQEMEVEALKELLNAHSSDKHSELRERAHAILSCNGVKDQYCQLLERENADLKAEISDLRAQTSQKEMTRLTQQNAKLLKQVVQLEQDLADEKGAFYALIQMQPLPKTTSRYFM